MTNATGSAATDVESAPDAGTSLIELLVAIGLFGLLGTLLLGFAISTSVVTKDTRSAANIAEESRLGMERLTRELRQAESIEDIQLPATSTDPLRFTLWADFNGNNCADADALDPEVLTYEWAPPQAGHEGRLTLTANIDGEVRQRRVLASNVTQFKVGFHSSSWKYDAPSGPNPTDGPDGVITWEELDSSRIGNGNGRPDGVAELKLIDILAVTMTVADNTENTHSISYRTAVNLRNQDGNSGVRACP